METSKELAGPTLQDFEDAREELLQAAEEGSTAHAEARALLRNEASAPTRRRCLGTSPCLVCAGVTALIVVSVSGAAGVWLAMDDGRGGPSARSRGLSAPLVSGQSAAGSGAGAASTRGDVMGSPCDSPLCRAEARLDDVKRWDGWTRVVPFLVTGTETTGTTTETTTTTETVTQTTTTTTTSTTTTTTTPCVVLEEGDDCYKEVLHVLYDMRENPDSRDGLSLWSSFEDVQSWLHENESKSKCMGACECQVVPIDSHCYSSLVFARGTGIREHPEWYPSLTEDSSTYGSADFQKYLWEHANETECPRPCRAFPRSDPSLFCWSLSRQWSYEADVMRAQLAAGAGIFGCDGFAVVSEEEWSIGWGPGGRIGELNTLSFPGAPVGVSKDGTAGNAQLFMNAWDTILDRTLVLDFDWAIKVDPDAVVVPDRVRDHVRDKTGSNVFVRNCEGATWQLMFGSLETISRGGLQVYKEGRYRCRNELDWYSWGEDFFLDKCFLHLGVGSTNDLSIISDGVCHGVDCNDGWAAAFHPFKGSNEWMNCWNTVKNNLGGPPHPPLP
ncbi:unnamed protein product [Prorocentrum cordatum]|uniref:Uncharacterized protein n=1 Tax=Prorocentrum cordatum TaxID=2364126 RepID=A0ABN9QP40_9DINO|nr:unnamed protein product [Polarella glacialis]